MPRAARADVQLRERADRREGGDRDAGAGEEPLLPQPVLGGVEDRSRRPHGSVRGGGLGGVGGDVLELEGDDVHPAGEVADRVEVVIGGLDLAVGDLAGGGVVVRGEGVHPVAHPAGGDGEHAAELAAAEDADGGAREDRLQGRVSSRTRRVCSAANSASFSRSSGRVVARIRMASRAALAAPALPMASVPTGTPEGI